MKNIIALAFSALIVAGTSADDIDMLVRDISPRGTPYFHVVLDSSPTAFRVLCTYGPSESCAPPFMSEKTYSYLRAGHRPGDQVTRFEVLSAILSGIFSRPAFQSVNVSLLISDRDNGARVLSTYKRLGADYGGVSGAQILISAIAAIPLETIPGKEHRFQAKDAFYIWYRYIKDMQQLEFDSCPKFFSVMMATESSFEDGFLDPEIKRDLDMPASVINGFTGMLGKMHASSTDLVPQTLGGNNFLDKTWVVAPRESANLSRDWAKAGGSNRPLNIDDPVLLEQSLDRAFLHAISRSSTVVAPWAPVSTVGSAYPAAPGVFFGMSEPRATLPWPGNLKKYHIGKSSLTAERERVVDKNFSAVTVSEGRDKGRISANALDFWSEVKSLPYDGVGIAVPGVDGRVVARGGAGQRIPGFLGAGGGVVGGYNIPGGSRQVYAEPESIINGSENALLPFNADGGATAESLVERLEASSIAQAQALIRWGRGLDVDDEDGDEIRSEPRSWLMGSVLHSKATTLNYGPVAGYSADNPNIRVFIGTGDGIFHGLENTTSSGAESGREVFAFYPNEGLRQIKAHREGTISSAKMQYGVDGGISVLTVDNNSDGAISFRPPDLDEAYVYFGLRRGGYSYYALDVSNPSAAPTLQWKITRSAAAGRPNEFDELGLTFSKPLVGKVRYAEHNLDVVIFAGGYNGGWDENFEYRVGKDMDTSVGVAANGETNTGNAIYIVNARTGALVWKTVYGGVTDTAASSSNTRFRHAEMIDSIPSTVSVMTNANGVIDRLYVGDTGGALWRVDLPAASGDFNPNHRKQHWFASKLAELGGEGPEADRRFFHGPDIVRTKDSSGTPIDGILISSGDRAHPNETKVANYHFYIKDALVISGDDGVRLRPAITLGKVGAASDLPDRTTCLTKAAPRAGLSCELSTHRGWMIAMTAAGEKSLSSPLVVGGRVFFTSYVPPQFEDCSVSAGEAYAYIVNLEDAAGNDKGQRIYRLATGMASAVMALGESLLMPLGGIEDSAGAECASELCKQAADKLYKIYWREPGIDEL